MCDNTKGDGGNNNREEGAALAPLTGDGYPVAVRTAHERVTHGRTFCDPYEWMRDKDSPQVRDYVSAQNDLFTRRMKPLEPLVAVVENELKNRVVETDVTVPTRVDNYWYFGRTHEGSAYGVTCRVKVAGPDDWTPPEVEPDSILPGEQIVFDSNVESQGHDFFAVGGLSVSKDGRLALYETDVHGDERYDVHLRNLDTGEDLPDVIGQVAAGSLLTPDGQWVFYVKVDESWRPWVVWRHRVGTPVESDVEAWRETDERFWVGVGLSFDEKTIIIESDSKTTSELLYLPVDNPTGSFTPFIPRKEGVEYDVTFSRFEGAGENGADIPVAVVIHNVTNPNFEIDVIDMRTHRPPYTLGEGRVIAAGCPAGCEKSPAEWRDKPCDMVFSDPRNPTVLNGARGLKIGGLGIYRNFVVLDWRADSLVHIAICPKAEAARAFLTGEPWPFEEIRPASDDAGEHVWSMGFGSNPSYDAPAVRYACGSYTMPSEIRQRTPDGADTLLKRRKVTNYNPTDYAEARLWVTVRDGARVPVSLVWRRGMAPALDALGVHGMSDLTVDAPRPVPSGWPPAGSEEASGGNAGSPLFITGYGAYGISSDPGFASSRPSLLDRGVVYACAHVRGGGEMGRAWYEQGRRLNKGNTFTDFIDVTAALQAHGWCRATATVADGGSAGGLLMGAVVNMAPDLYAGVEADVPFVDALTSILDPSLPLTVTEWDEWGDPLHDAAVYDYMASYSPYENTPDASARTAEFGSDHIPRILITTSMNDTRVLYVEPMKWLARLQEARVGADAIARIEIEAGHGGGSGRYVQWHELSQENAWTLAVMGIFS